MPILNTVLAFLSSDLTLPVWVPLLLFLTSLPVFIKLLRWFKKPKAAAPKIKQAQTKRPPATKAASESIFTSSVISAVDKLKSMKDPALHTLTDSIATTASKIKSAIDSKEKLLEPVATSRTPKTQRVSGKTQSEDEKDKVIKLLLASGSDGKLNQSLADEMKVSSAIVTSYLNDLMQTKLVDSRRQLIGEIFYLTSLGKAYCVEKGYTQ